MYNRYSSAAERLLLSCVRAGCVCPPELRSMQVVEMRQQFGKKYAWILVMCLLGAGAARVSVAVAETQETIASFEGNITGAEQAGDEAGEMQAGPPVIMTETQAGLPGAVDGSPSGTQESIAAPDDGLGKNAKAFTMSGSNSGIVELPVVRMTEEGPVELLENSIAFVGDAANRLSEEQKEIIRAYLERYYEAVGSLERADLSDLFAPSAAGEKAFNEKAIEYVIGIRTMQDADLHIKNYRSELTVSEVSANANGSVEAELEERSICRFAQSPDMDSEYSKLKHTFTLVRQNGAWLIQKHMQEDTFFWTLQKDYDRQDLNQIKNAESVFENKKNKLLDQRRNDLPARKEDAAAQVPAVDHPYDREAAIAYARQYVGRRNESWYDYSDEGGNCQNFASQCIFAGGIPMDVAGDQKWKWYSNGVNGTASAWGCSRSWLNVDYFYAYARDNRGYGMSAEIAADFWSGQPGDAIVVGTPSDWTHTVLISKVVKDANGRVIDYLLCSNTLDVKDYPLSAYPQTGGALIRIFGWND